jgi:hypothetical protein
MRFSLLGPLVVADGTGDRATLAGPRLRVLLAALLLHANIPVPAGELAEMVWDGSPPAGAVATLRSYATRLRRALGIREIVGVAYRLVPGTPTRGGGSAEDTENLQFMHVFDQGVETAARRGSFSVLTSSVDANDNAAGMRDLARHLIHDHGYQTLAYLAGNADCPANADRRNAVAAVAGEAGIELLDGPDWQGSYYQHGGTQVIEKLIRERKTLPRAIACANDLTAIGAIHALARHGIAVPRDVAVTGFDDLPLARRLRPPLTTVRTPIWELGTTAFALLHTTIRNRYPQQPAIVLPDRLICRESCGCPPDRTRRPNPKLQARKRGPAL